MTPQERAGEKLSALLGDPLGGKEPVLFLSSGGSCLELLDHVDLGVLGSHCTLGVLDDRWSSDPDISNFLKLSFSKFAQAAHEHGCAFIATVPKAGDTIEQTAKRFEAALRDWKARNPGGRVIITQGIGTDGHTAGIMPFPEDPAAFDKKFNDPGHWVIGYDAGNKNPYPQRITVTLPFLREMVNYSLVYAPGVDKADALQKALAPGPLAEVPARIVQEIQEKEVF